MSGPKTSRYRVSVEQLRRIREEKKKKKKELEKKAREEREYRKAKEYLAEVDSRIDRQMGILDSKESGAVTEGVIISKKAEEEKRRFMAVVTKIRSICHDKELNSHAHLMSARDQVETLLREALSLSNDLMESFDSLVIDHRISEDKKIADSMQISFASICVL